MRVLQVAVRNLRDKMLRKGAWAGQCALTKIRVVFALFILFWAFPSYARDDAAQLSLSSAKALAQSILASLPAQMPQAEKDKWVDILHLPDNPAIQVSSLAQIPALLPLPSATILRLAQQLSQQQSNRTLSLHTASPVIGFAGYDQNRTIDSPQPLSQTTRLLITHSILKQLIWQKISGTAQLSDNGGYIKFLCHLLFRSRPQPPFRQGRLYLHLPPRQLLFRLLPQQQLQLALPQLQPVLLRAHLLPQTQLLGLGAAMVHLVARMAVLAGIIVVAEAMEMKI